LAGKAAQAYGANVRRGAWNTHLFLECDWICHAALADDAWLEAEFLGIAKEHRCQFRVQHQDDGIGIGGLQAQHLGGCIVGVGREFLTGYRGYAFGLKGL
jgi:hypothetical protein